MRLPKYKKFILSHLSYFGTCIDIVRICFLSSNLTNSSNTTLHTIFFLLSPILAMGLPKIQFFFHSPLYYFGNSIAIIQNFLSPLFSELLGNLAINQLGNQSRDEILSLYNFGNTIVEIALSLPFPCHIISLFSLLLFLINFDNIIAKISLNPHVAK